MPCPYAEKKGPVVYCRLIGKKVNPLAFPCLTNKYERCKYYRQKTHAAEQPREEKPQAPQPPKPTTPPPAPVPVPAGKPETGRARGETKGLTLDGRRPTNCLECIYYGAKTKTCLLLGVTVEDPYDPPCAKM